MRNDRQTQQQEATWSRKAYLLTSPAAKARLAAKIIMARQGWPIDNGPGRAFDSCFENGDGDAVHWHFLCLRAADEKLDAKCHALGQTCEAHDAKVELIRRRTQPSLFEVQA